MKLKLSVRNLSRDGTVHTRLRSLREGTRRAFLDFDNHQIKIHPVQSVDRLEPYFPDSYQGNDSRRRPPPEPEMVEGELYYEVARIIDRRYVRNRYEYRVQWVGFESRQAQWLTENWI